MAKLLEILSSHLKKIQKKDDNIETLIEEIRNIDNKEIVSLSSLEKEKVLKILREIVFFIKQELNAIYTSKREKDNQAKALKEYKKNVK
jgi:hypothetical protein